MITTKKLFKQRQEIRTIARSLGFKHLRVRPPILSSLKEPFKELYFIADVKGKYKLSSLFALESKLQKLLGVKVHVETDADIDIASRDVAVAKRYDKLEGAAIHLTTLQKELPLETQWQDALREEGHSFSNSDFAEFLVDSTSPVLLTKSEIDIPKPVSVSEPLASPTKLVPEPSAKSLPFFKEKLFSSSTSSIPSSNLNKK